MMSKKTTLSLLLLAGMALLLAGCEEPLDFKVKKGESIRVRVAARNGALTKTVYSGNTYKEGDKNYERIDWVSGDKIRLFSTNTDEVATTDRKAFFDYTIDQVGTNDPADRYSNATLFVPESHENYGLVWVNEPSATTTVYGIYPPMDEKGEEQEAVTNSGQLSGFVGLNIPAPDLNWNTNGVGSPTENYMKHAYMVSAPSKFTTSEDEGWAGKPYVNLDFYPIFNSFEIELVGEKESEFPVNWVSLSNEVESGTNSYSALTGDYRFNYKGRAGNYPFPPTGENITQTGNKGHTVQVNLPANTMLSSTKSVKFTILTLPPTANEKLSNLVVTVNHGNNKISRLRLNKNNAPFEFPAFQKARIKCQALDGGDSWLLTIRTAVNEWTFIQKETSFSEQIGIRDVNVSGMTETGNHEMGNEEAAGTDAYYARYYQIRTLDMSEDNPHFVVKFTPFAPIGGYWMLNPEGIGERSLQYFDIKVYLGEGIYSDELIGQIMGTEVEIHIFPSADFDPNAGESYAMIMKCFFSSQLSFDDPYSADSEFQDVHGDGRYSYWRFTLPSNN